MIAALYGFFVPFIALSILPRLFGSSVSIDRGIVVLISFVSALAVAYIRRD